MVNMWCFLVNIISIEKTVYLAVVQLNVIGMHKYILLRVFTVLFKSLMSLQIFMYVLYHSLREVF